MYTKETCVYAKKMRVRGMRHGDASDNLQSQIVQKRRVHIQKIPVYMHKRTI